MIRPVTAICMLAAGASGLYLYQTKHRAVMLDRQIMSVLKQTEATRERIGVMRAEWALLNEPERLAELSGKHLGLRTLAPTQFASIADLGSRLPPPVAPGTPPPSEEEPQQPAGPAPAAVPPAVAPIAAAPAAAAVTAPAPRAAARPSPVQASAPVQPVQAASSAPARPPAAPRLPRTEARDEASATPKPLQAAPPHNPASSARAMAPVVSVAAAPILVPRASVPGIGEAVATRAAAAPRTPVAQPAWAPGPAPTPAPQGYTAQYAPAQYSPVQSALGQSALGGPRPSLPPPVPYGAQPR